MFPVFNHADTLMGSMCEGRVRVVHPSKMRKKLSSVLSGRVLYFLIGEEPAPEFFEYPGLSLALGALGLLRAKGGRQGEKPEGGARLHGMSHPLYPNAIDLLHGQPAPIFPSIP